MNARDEIREGMIARKEQNLRVDDALAACVQSLEETHQSLDA